jgi:hypothetical protein
MFGLLFALSIVGTVAQIVNEAFSKPVPAENWANKELYHEDIMNGVSIEQRMKNLDNGRYKMQNAYPEPHRDPVSGKIVIENSRLYYEDIEKYGASKAQQWMKQGRYNLEPEELKKEEERIKERYKYLYKL